MSKKIAVIIPAFNEELLILKTLNSVPTVVDKIFVINDASTDSTESIVMEAIKDNKKINLISLEKNSGVGYSIVKGYEAAYNQGYDIGVVMPGDAQALPEDFINLIDPVLNLDFDYSKGNRLKNKNVAKIMPKHRLYGNTILTLLTKFASGYYHIMDPQMGYTALNLKILPKLNISTLIKRYGYPGHLLYLLNLADAKVVDVDVIPHYGEEKSGIKLFSFIPKLVFLLLRLFISRVFKKLVKENLSPAGLSYSMSFLFIFFIIPFLIIRSINLFSLKGYIPELTFISLTTSITLFFVFFFFGVMFDVQENQKK